MVIIYGRRAYGRVDAQDGEFADTQFAHFDFVPLFPIASHWLTQELPSGERIGFPIKLHLRSVAATYLRTWAPGLALILFATGSLAGTAAAGVLVALCAWSWTWRTRRGALARRRADFDRVALGSRCEPTLLTGDMHERLQCALDARHAKREDARPPDDVARFGAKDVDEAVIAYGLLRLSAVRHRAAAEAADRLLTSAFDRLPSDGGPYREASGNASDLGAKIARAAQVATETSRAAAGRAQPPVRRRWFQRPWVQLVLLLWITPAAWAIASDEDLGPGARVIGARQLASINPPYHRQVKLRCDRVETEGWPLATGPQARQCIALCWVGDKVVPVVPDDNDANDDHVDSAVVQGMLRDIPDDAPWAVALSEYIELDRGSYGLYVSTSSLADRAFGRACGYALVIGVIAGWGFWFRALWRRRRARNAG